MANQMATTHEHKSGPDSFAALLDETLGKDRAEGSVIRGTVIAIENDRSYTSRPRAACSSRSWTKPWTPRRATS